MAICKIKKRTNLPDRGGSIPQKAPSAWQVLKGARSMIYHQFFQSNESNGNNHFPSKSHFSVMKYICTLVLLSVISTISFAADLSKPDVRIVVDISGSMKQNDPNNLRIPAVNMLIGLLPDNATAGVWTFGRYVNMLVPHKPVTDQWRTQARTKIKKINSVAQHTHIELALKKSGYDISNGKTHKNTHVILLTDGQVDISKDRGRNKDSRNKIIRELTKKYSDAGIKIHTVALSKQADHLLLDRISLTTGGISTVADGANQLMQMFLQVLDQAAPQDQLPITGNSFQIDSSVEEATVLLFRKSNGQPTRLTDPDGQVWQSSKLSREMKWFEDEKFDLITITKPKRGDWVIDSVEHPDNRVSVISDLKMRVVGLPAVIAREDPLTMSVFFQEKDRLLDDRQFLDLIDISIQIDRNGAKLGTAKVTDFPIVDGKYQVKLRSLGKYASYAILIEADGKTFSRKFQRIFKIAPPPPEDPELDDLFEQPVPEPEIELQEESTPELMEHPVLITIESVGTTEEQGYDLILKIVDPTIATASTRVISMIAGPDGSTFIGTVDTVSRDTWEMKFGVDELPALGEYNIQFSFSGEQTGGKKFEYKPDSLLIAHPDDWVNPIPESIEPDLTEQQNIDEEVIDPVEGVEEILLDQLEDQPVNDEPEAGSEADSEDDSAWYENGWVIGGLILLFNLLVIGGGIVAYRKLVNDSPTEPEVNLPVVEPEVKAPVPEEQGEVISDQSSDEEDSETSDSLENDELQDLLNAVDEELISEQPEVENAVDEEEEVGVVEDIGEVTTPAETPAIETAPADEILADTGLATEDSSDGSDDIDALMAEFDKKEDEGKSTAPTDSEDIDALMAEFGEAEEAEKDKASPAAEDTPEETADEASPDEESSAEPKQVSDNETPDDDFEVVGFDEDLSDDP